MTSENSDEGLRLDIWLDVSCLYRTRSEAQRACRGGKISVNNFRAKAHREIHPGDLITITIPNGHKRQLRVETLSSHYIPKALAKALYQDITPLPSTKEKELKDLLLWVEPTAGTRQGSPDKRKRRIRRAIKEQQN